MTRRLHLDGSIRSTIKSPHDVRIKVRNILLARACYQPLTYTAFVRFLILTHSRGAVPYSRYMVPSSEHAQLFTRGRRCCGAICLRSGYSLLLRQRYQSICSTHFQRAMLKCSHHQSLPHWPTCNNPLPLLLGQFLYPQETTKAQSHLVVTYSVRICHLFVNLLVAGD